MEGGAAEDGLAQAGRSSSRRSLRLARGLEADTRADGDEHRVRRLHLHADRQRRHGSRQLVKATPSFIVQHRCARDVADFPADRDPAKLARVGEVLDRAPHTDVDAHLGNGHTAIGVGLVKLALEIAIAHRTVGEAGCAGDDGRVVIDTAHQPLVYKGNVDREAEAEDRVYEAMSASKNLTV